MATQAEAPVHVVRRRTHASKNGGCFGLNARLSMCESSQTANAEKTRRFSVASFGAPDLPPRPAWFFKRNTRPLTQYGMLATYGTWKPQAGREPSQLPFQRCLVPELKAIFDCSFYWGMIDQIRAEGVLDGKPDGTYLLRDSTCKTHVYLFSVSFRMNGSTRHIRILQVNNKFTFNKASQFRTVLELVAYHNVFRSRDLPFKLSEPLPRPNVFALQNLCRAAVCNELTYGKISRLPVEEPMKDYLSYYHYNGKLLPC